MGPSQSISSRLTSTGQALAVWLMNRSDETSYFSRTSLGSLSSLTKIVGTATITLIRCFSISARNCSASKRGVMTSSSPWVAA